MAGSEPFWNEPSLEPKRQHRWLLYVGTGGGIGIPHWFVKRVDKPKFMVNTIAHSYFGHKFYYPGNVEWQQTTFTLIDPIEPDMTEKLYKALIGGGYNVPESQTVHTLSKDLSVSVLGESITLQQLDSTNTPVDEFVLINPWITNVDFGSLAYESDAMLELTVTIRYDYARFPGLN